MADPDMTQEEAGHGLRPARGVMFGLAFTAIGFLVIGSGCLAFLHFR